MNAKCITCCFVVVCFYNKVVFKDAAIFNCILDACFKYCTFIDRVIAGHSDEDTLM